MNLFLNQRLAGYRKRKGLSQKELGAIIGKSQQTIGHYEKGIREPSFRDVQLLSEALNCAPTELVGLDSRLRAEPVPDQTRRGHEEVVGEPTRVELPLVSIADRVGFVTLKEEPNYGLPGTVSLVTTSPSRDFRGQIIVEINGDNMEPRLCMGDRVRCRPVPVEDWPFLPAGVYAVSFSHYFVVKRIKNNDLQSRQVLTLHADNPQTGGSLDVPIQQLHHLWQVVEMVSGWVR